MRRGTGADLDAVELLAELGGRFAAGHEGDARAGHQVAFVGRVHEHLAAGGVAVLEDQLRDPAAVAFHALEAVLEEDRDAEVGEHRQEERLHLGRALDLLLEEIEVDRLRHAADGGLFAVVDIAQAGGGHPTDVAAEDEDAYRLAHLLRLAGRGDRRRAGAVDHDVELERLRRGLLGYRVVIAQSGVRRGGLGQFPSEGGDGKGGQSQESEGCFDHRGG